jgi:hypothetical protein
VRVASDTYQQRQADVNSFASISSSHPSIMVKGKVFTVSGAASGIGQATAIRLAELGARAISISDINLVGLEATKDTCKFCQTHVKFSCC